MEIIHQISPEANTLSMIRTDEQEKQTLGELFVLDPIGNILFQCYTLELPWRNNARKVSSFPPGRYRIKPRSSKRFPRHLHILDVPNRDYILIHNANYVRQLEGCIAVGLKKLDIDGDGLLDVTDSVNTLNKLLKFIPGPSLLILQ